MKIVYNKIIPFGSYSAINLFGILFSKRKTIPKVLVNHESIHTEQMKEMLFVFFYLWYVVEFMFKLIIERNWYKAYRAISFEREAYDNQNDSCYIKNRQKYSWINYMKGL